VRAGICLQIVERIRKPPRGRNRNRPEGGIVAIACLLRSALAWVRGSGGEGLSRSPCYRNGIHTQSCLIFSPGAFHIPVMVLSSSPTGYRTDFGDKPQSITDRLRIIENLTSYVTVLDLVAAPFPVVTQTIVYVMTLLP